MIQFENVSFAYNKKNTISDVSFTIEDGDFVVIVGTNGAGKSTLSKMCNGLLKPTKGRVLVDGMNTLTTKTSALARRVGFLFQNPDRQICQNTVKEEILFGLRCVYTDEQQIQEKYERTVKNFDLPQDKAPFSLSRGERQRVALASLIAVEPDILLLDEPTTGLDYRECMQMMEYIKEMNRQGTTIIMVCHDMEVVLDFADRILVMHDGRLVADGKTQDIFMNKEVLEQANLLPPQIAGVALELGEGFENIFRVSEMMACIKERKLQNERIS